MKAAKSILFYLTIILALGAYINNDLSGSFLCTGITQEMCDGQAASETKEGEEKDHAEEFFLGYSLEFYREFPAKMLPCCFRVQFVACNHASVVWIPPQGARQYKHN